MSCQIIYKNREVSEVRAENGSPSLLYRDLKTKYGESKALELFKVANSNTFKDILAGKRKAKIQVNQTDMRVERVVTKDYTSYIPYLGSTRLGSLRIKTNLVADQMTIYKKFKGRGYGKALFQYAIRDFAEQGMYITTPQVYSADAQSLLSSLEQDGVMTKQEDGSYIVNVTEGLYPNGEASIKMVEEYIQNQQKTERLLTTEEIVELDNFLMSQGGDIQGLRDTLNRVFYNEDGFFVVSPNKLKEVYSPQEVRRILESPTVQDNIKNSLEAFNNTEDLHSSEYIVDKSEVEYSDTFNSFGKRDVINPNKATQDVLEQVAGAENITEFDSLLQNTPYEREYVTFEESQEYKKAELLVQVGVETKAPNVGDRVAISLKMDEKTSNLLRKVEYLAGKTQNSLNRNQDDTRVVLNSIERTATEAGLDFIGLQDKIEHPQLLPLMRATAEMLRAQTLESTQMFSEVYSQVFPENVPLQTRAVKFSENRDYVYLETPQSEVEVYEQHNMIKVGDNTYIRVNDKPLDYLYSLVEGVSEEQNQREASKYAGNRETAEKINLLKKVFKTPEVTQGQIEPLPYTSVEIDSEYLTKDYVADFNRKLLREKRRNSSLYSNFYSNFEITEKGIELKYTDGQTLETVNRLADENLRKYSLIAKHMPLLEIEVDENPNQSQVSRDYYVNNPNKAPLIQGNTTVLDRGIFAGTGTEQFVRTPDGRLYEAVTEDQGVIIYAELPKNTTDYNVFNTPKPVVPSITTNLIPKKESTQPRKRQNKEIINNEFDCI